MQLNQLHLETEQLVVRPATETDYEAFVAGHRDCLPARNRFDEGVFDTSFMTREWYSSLLKRRREEAERDYSYMLNIFRRSDGRSVGYANIMPHMREEFQYARIGYTIHNPYWGNGYATETARALIKLGFGPLALHRLEAHVNLDNPASGRVLRKAGFTFECVRRGFIYEDGAWTDQEIYAIISEDAKRD